MTYNLLLIGAVAFATFTVVLVIGYLMLSEPDSDTVWGDVEAKLLKERARVTEKQAAAGDIWAQWRTSEAYRHGWGVKRDLKKAEYWESKWVSKS